MSKMIPVVLRESWDWHSETNQCSRDTRWSRKTYDLRIEYGQPGVKQPVLLQIGTTDVADSVNFILRVRPRNGIMLMENFYSRREGTAIVARPVVWLLPNERYVVDIDIPPAREKRLWYSFGFRKTWVPRYNFFIKASKLGDKHQAEFGKD